MMRMEEMSVLLGIEFFAIIDYIDCIAIIRCMTVGAITIRKIDDALKQAMREEAAANGRSIEAEVRALLERTYGARGGDGRRPGEGRMEYLLRIAPDMTGFELPERQSIREPRFP